MSYTNQNNKIDLTFTKSTCSWCPITKWTSFLNFSGQFHTYIFKNLFKISLFSWNKKIEKKFIDTRTSKFFGKEGWWTPTYFQKLYTFLTLFQLVGSATPYLKIRIHLSIYIYTRVLCSTTGVVDIPFIMDPSVFNTFPTFWHCIYSTKPNKIYDLSP